jgi:DNA polymerase V
MKTYTLPTNPINLQVNLFGDSVPAGFPSPADDYLESTLDLNEHLVARPNSTFMVRVQGDSMIDVGIFPNSLLVIDRSITPKSKDIVLAIVDGQFTIKRFLRKTDGIYLAPENNKYKVHKIREDQEFEVWGVVAHAIQSYQR